MKLTLGIRLLLIGLLAGLGASAAVAVQAQETSAPAAKLTKASTTRAKPAKKKPAPGKWAATRKVAPGKVRPHALIASKSLPDSDALKTTLPPVTLDLSLPQDMVKRLEPVGKTPVSKNPSLLPPLFVEKNPEQTPFQLNGRLLKNEMELQLRNENRKEIDGAALDFHFKQ